MTAYGWNFEFRVSPKPNNRSGRYKNADVVIPIGVPVTVADGATRDPNGRLTFDLATAAAPPDPGTCGIAVYEYAFEAFEGRDPYLTTTSDLDTVPAGAPCQLVNGEDVVFVLYNTVSRPMLGRTYPGRTMIAGLGATPTLVIGDYVGPGTGNDSAGYWAETTRANAWAQIIDINPTRGAVECRLQF